MFSQFVWNFAVQLTTFIIFHTYIPSRTDRLLATSRDWTDNMASTVKGPKERPLIERFETAVTVIRSLPKDGGLVFSRFNVLSIIAKIGPFQPSDMVKLKVQCF